MTINLEFVGQDIVTEPLACGVSNVECLVSDTGDARTAADGVLHAETDGHPLRGGRVAIYRTRSHRRRRHYLHVVARNADQVSQIQRDSPLQK